MSMTTSVYGIKPPDKRFREMYAIFKACDDASITAPSAVWKYFNEERPDEAGVLLPLEKTPAVSPYKEEMQEGFEVDLTKLDKDIKIIRFVNSY